MQLDKRNCMLCVPQHVTEHLKGVIAGIQESRGCTYRYSHLRLAFDLYICGVDSLQHIKDSAKLRSELKGGKINLTI